jgi:hypothetical protein
MGLRNPWGKFLLSGVRLVLCLLAALTSSYTPGGTWHLLIPIDPPCAMFMFVITSNMGTLAVFAVLGTIQWFLIGHLIDVCIEFVQTRLHRS